MKRTIKVNKETKKAMNQWLYRMRENWDKTFGTNLSKRGKNNESKHT